MYKLCGGHYKWFVRFPITLNVEAVVAVSVRPFGSVEGTSSYHLFRNSPETLLPVFHNPGGRGLSSLLRSCWGCFGNSTNSDVLPEACVFHMEHDTVKGTPDKYLCFIFEVRKILRWINKLLESRIEKFDQIESRIEKFDQKQF